MTGRKTDKQTYKLHITLIYHFTMFVFSMGYIIYSLTNVYNSVIQSSYVSNYCVDNSKRKLNMNTLREEKVGLPLT